VSLGGGFKDSIFLGSTDSLIFLGDEKTREQVECAKKYFCVKENRKKNKIFFN
jgi:hypothetical protein